MIEKDFTKETFILQIAIIYKNEENNFQFIFVFIIDLGKQLIFLNNQIKLLYSDFILLCDKFPNILNFRSYFLY